MADLTLDMFMTFAREDLGLNVAEDRSWLDPDANPAIKLLRAADLAAAALGWSRADVLFGFGAWLDGRMTRDGALSRTRLLSSLLALRHEMERWLSRRHAFANLGNRTPSDRLTLQYRDSSALGDVLHGLLVARLRRSGARVQVDRQNFADMSGTQLHFRLERLSEDAAA